MFKGTQDRNISTHTIDIEIHVYTGRTDVKKTLPTDCFSLILLSKGSLSGMFNNKLYTLHSPMLLCFGSKDTIESLETDDSAECLVVCFNPSVLNRNLNMDLIYDHNYTDICELHHYLQLQPFLENAVTNKCFPINQKYAQTCKKRIEKINAYLSQQKEYYWYCRARSELILLLCFIENLMFKPVIKTQDNKTSEEFTRVIEYINTNISKHITLKHLYEKFFINSNGLEKLFAEYCGTTFRKYLRNKRLEIAKDQLMFTELSNKDIAYSVGFSTSQNFCKFFKEMTGITPDAFRKEQLKYKIR